MDAHIRNIGLPGVAQVAMQGGRYVGKLIRRRLQKKSAPRPFRYFDKGNMAVVGKGFAIIQSGNVRVSGFVAWLAWAYVHLSFLAARGLRVSVFVQWMWTYLTGARGSRIIVHPHAEVGAAAAIGDARAERVGQRSYDARSDTTTLVGVR
jgi:NADH dehydrogenase FAD-containing subunit